MQKKLQELFTMLTLPAVLLPPFCLRILLLQHIQQTDRQTDRRCDLCKNIYTFKISPQIILCSACKYLQLSSIQIQGGRKKNTFYLFCIEHSQGPRLMAQSTIEQKKRKSINMNKQRPVKEKTALSVENHVRQFKNIYLSSLFCLRLNLVIKLFKS